jgi:hypothetical protein
MNVNPPQGNFWQAGCATESEAGGRDLPGF